MDTHDNSNERAPGEAVTEATADAESVQAESHDKGAPAEEQSRTRPEPAYRGFERLKRSVLFGTFVYVYFALFVAVHAIVMIEFLLDTFHPWLGVILWIGMMLLAGVSVIALTVWRDSITTLWTDNN